MALPAPVQNIKTLVERFTLKQKIALAATGALVMALVWGAVYLSNRVDYQVVFSDLQPSEAQGILQKLQDLKVPYQLSADSRSISVVSEKASEVRIQLASQGLPASGRIGFEIFDQTNFGLTNFQEQVNYQRALEGELARSIMTLSEVEAARVHLVLPKDSLFQSPEDQTKASVILKLKNGRSLSDGAVQGIVNVVASSVKGLTPEHVTLIDYRGKVLARPETEGSLTGHQLDERFKLESELSTKIIQILEPAVGQGKVRPQVSVSMSFQQVEETTEHYDPEGSVVRSQQKQDERTPRPLPTSGIPGPKAAAQTATKPPDPAPSPSPDNVATKQSEIINYEVSKSVRHTVEPVGSINRVSVAVIIDNHTKVTNGTNGKPQSVSEPRSQDEMSKYRDIVAAAVGFNPERGDKLTIENVSFEEVGELVKEPTFIEKQAPLVLTGLRYLIIPIAFVLIYLLFLRPVKKVVFATLSAAGAGGGQIAAGSLAKALPGGSRAQAPMTVKQLEAQIAGGAGNTRVDNPERDLLPLPGPSKMEVIRDRVIEHATQDPETVARLVRVWLNDEKTK
jgi:flagellar M-ring protein FliF